jgi:hypothetical protein
MARIRTIKPEFWQDEKLARIPRDARLMFIGLWNIADDEGRLRGSPLFIRAQVFPYDLDVDVEANLASLEGLGCIQRYTVDGESFIWVRNFSEHQRIDRPKPSVLPAPTLRDESSIDRRSVDDASSQKVAGREGKGKEQGKEVEGSASAPSSSEQIEPPRIANPGSPALTFFVWAQETREQQKLPREKPPARMEKLSAWFSEAMSEMRGDEKRLRETWLRFGDDKYWESRAYPFNGFISQWRKYVPPT